MALVGNPSSGKTTLFNALTGSSQRIANFAGATVEKIEGYIQNEFYRACVQNTCASCAGGCLVTETKTLLVDLPGVYSLSPCSREERITLDYLIHDKPNVILNIVDITNLERNLYLTTQLLDLQIPIIVVLNLMDVAKAQRIQVDIITMAEQLGVTVVTTSAKNGEGFSQLLSEASRVAEQNLLEHTSLLRWGTPALRTAVSHVAERYTLFGLSFHDVSPLWASLRILENDENMIASLHIPVSFLHTVSTLRGGIEKKADRSIDEIIVDARYTFIAEVLRETVHTGLPVGKKTLSEKIDRIVLNRFLGIPLFFLIMLCVFELTFSSNIGGRLNGLLSFLICNQMTSVVSHALHSIGAHWFLTSLVSNGILYGIGSVLSFLPWILILFFCLAFLEDCGYLSRAAFLLDRAFRRFGMSGNSFIPMLLGFGCSVPALMSTRTIRDEKQRRITLMVTPFMSCSARLPIYVLFAAAFFQYNQGVAIFSIYLLGIAVAAVSGAFLNKLMQSGYSAPLVMELPPYRLPTIKSLFLHTWNRAKQFLIKAGTILFLTSLLVWFLQSFSVKNGFHLVSSAQDSALADIGHFISPFFAPLGFGDWKSAVALLTGFIAKESVVSTMGFLHGVSDTGNAAAIAQSIQSAFTPLSAYAFMAFALLYVPCMAAFAVLKREMNSWKWTLATLSFEIGVAWLVSFVIYQGGRLLGLA